MTRPIRAASAALLILVASTLATSCSKSDNKATNPPALVLNSGDLAASQSYEKRFFAAGSFPYHCVHHGSMTGTITVSASQPASDSLKSVSIVNFAFSGGTVTIPVGGKVTWTNNSGGTVHTVSSN